MNASFQHGYYMSGGEIAKAISDVSTMACEVITHGDQHQLVHGTAYQPRGMTPKFLSVRKRYLSEITGYAFGEGSAHPGLIIEAEGKALIATRFEFPRRHNSYFALHTISDYVSIWIVGEGLISGDEARKAIDEVLFHMGQLLPDGHRLKRVEASEVPAEEYAGSNPER